MNSTQRMPFFLLSGAMVSQWTAPKVKQQNAIKTLVAGLEHVFSIFGKNNPNWLSYFSEGWLNHQPEHIKPSCYPIYPMAPPPALSGGGIYCRTPSFWLSSQSLSSLTASLKQRPFAARFTVATVLGKLPSVYSCFQWPFQEPIDWRYLPYIRPVFEAYVREYPHKIWPYMVQYLHFRILKFPLMFIQPSNRGGVMG